MVAQSPVDPRFAGALRRFAAAVPWVALAAGSLVLLGWAFDSASLKTLAVGSNTVKPLTALAFVAAGLALVHGRFSHPASRRVGLWLAVGVAALGALLLLEYVTGLALGLDQVLFGAAVRAEGGLHPGRPAPNTAIILLLLGGALLASSLPARRLVLFLALPSSLMALLAAVGHAYGVPMLYALGPYSPMSLPSALLALLLALGLLAADVTNPLTAMLISRRAGGALARGLLPAAIVLPLIFGWVRIQGQHRGVVDIEFGQALVTVANIIVFAGLILYNARLLNRTDAQHDAARLALAESEERFRLLADSTPNGLLMVAADGRIALSNKQAEHLFGYAPGALLGVVVDQLAPARLREPHRVHREHFWDNPAPRPMGTRRDLIGCRLDGTEFPAEIVLVPMETRAGRFTLASIIDITQRQAAEREILNLNATLEQRVHDRTAELAANEAKLRALFDVLPVGVSILDQQRQVVEANPALTRILRLAGQKLTASTFAGRRYLHPDGHAFKREELASARAFEEQQVILNVETGVITETGETIWTSVSAAPLPDQGAVVVTSDISQRKLAEAALEDANQKLTHWVAELEQRNREISLLSQLGSLLQACATVEEAYAVIARVGQWLYPHETGVLGVVHSDRPQVEVVGAWGISPAPAFEPQACWALRRGHVHFTELGQGVEADHTLALVCQHVSRPLPAATVCIPLMAQGKALGVLALAADPANAQPSRLVGPAAQQLVQALADHIALALGNLQLQASLREQSVRDPLTGLFNRRYLEDWLDRELLRANRAGRSVGLVLIDLDHFKRVNDTFGHEAGDVVLKDLASYFQRFIRGGDVACRLGGEEFLLVLPEAELAATGHRAEQLCDGVRHLPIAYRNTTIGPLTVSIGVAAFPAHGDTTAALLRVADAALYRAKHQGRDQVHMGP